MKMRLAVCCFSVAGCGGDAAETCDPVETIEVGDTYAPVFDAADFPNPPVVDNEWFPLTPGTTQVYEGSEDGEQIHSEWEVTTDTKLVTIDGAEIHCVVVHDHEDIDGVLAEDTRDWFAQDVDGNVWYMGEETAEYEDGEVTSTAGSWEAGVDGALPGIVMQATPVVGDGYRQEYYPGEAMDVGEVIEMGATVTADGVEYTNVLVTRELNLLDLCVDEAKYHASGIGLVKVEALHGSDEVQELQQ